MSRLVTVTALAAALVGVLAGFLWWGMPTGHLQTELRSAQSNADRLGEQVGQLSAANEKLGAQLKAVEADLRREKEVNARLHMIVSQGKK